MDKQIKPKNKKTKKILLYSIPCMILLGVIFMSLTRKKQVNLSKESITIRKVTQGEFEDVMLFNSTVEPKTSVLVNVIQGGAVAEVFVESGTMVTKGTPLLRVYNPNAELNYLTQETAIIEQINNLRNIRANIKNQQLNLTQQLLSITNDFNNAERQYKLDNNLHNRGVIAKNDFQKTSQEFSFQKERKEVIQKSVSEEKKSGMTQLSNINTSIANMEKSLMLLRKNKENFVVKAPVSGLLSSFNPVLGESYTQGISIGKIDVLDGFKLVAKVDEYYISKLQEGIQGSVQVDSKKYAISIEKIYPEVVNGKFTVALFFEDNTVADYIKRGMSLKTKLYLSNSKKALLISKGQFYNSTNGKWAFVLNKDNKAVKRLIKIGRENPFYYEVLEGLNEGDQIITSSYDEFEKVEEINIE